MSLNGDFKNAHFLSTGKILNEIFDVLSSEFPNIFLIYETFKCTFNAKVANSRVVRLAYL